MPTRRPRPCARRSARPTAAAPSRWPTTNGTASPRRPSGRGSRTSRTSWRWSRRCPAQGEPGGCGRPRGCRPKRSRRSWSSSRRRCSPRPTTCASSTRPSCATRSRPCGASSTSSSPPPDGCPSATLRAVELERKSIERRDFPEVRRGYEPAEVDAHLARIAEAVEQLRGASTAATAAQRVRAIVEAAERSAAEIEAGAREQAERGRTRAQADLAETLSRAGKAEGLLEQAAEELERLREALATLRGTLEPPASEPAVAASAPLAPQPPAEPEEAPGAPHTAAEAEEAHPATAHAEPRDAEVPAEGAQPMAAEGA